MKSALRFSVQLGIVMVSSAAQAAAQGTFFGANAQMREVLEVFKTIEGKPVYEKSPQAARQQFSAEDAAKIVARASGKSAAAEHVDHIIDGKQIPGPASSLPIRVYVPAGSGPLPVVVYFHGGGFVLATVDTYDASARALAARTPAIVVSVEYRKAPEAPFPAAVDDALAAYQWVLANAGAFGGDAGRVAVAGESAGGNLAAEVSLLARDRGLPMPRHQLLIYPVTDFSKVDYPSDLKYAAAVPLNVPALAYFGANYLRSSSSALDPKASPIHATLQSLPPTTIIAAEIDPLLDQGKLYADSLRAAGVSVKYVLYPGVTHEFFGMGAVLDEAETAEDLAAAQLRAAFR